MEELKEKKKVKGILTKTWERCKSFGNLQAKRVPNDQISIPTSPPPMVKSKSLSYLYKSSPDKLGRAVGSPHGYFSIYVGPEKQRFVIKVECTKHPLFKMLLEEAESEFGFHTDHGPLVLPCDVDFFIKVLTQMDGHDESKIGGRPLTRSRSSYRLLTSPALLDQSNDVCRFFSD